MLRRYTIALLLGLWTAPAFAQITLPFPAFSTPTILRSEVTANDAQLASVALNRTGGTMTGGLSGTTITLSSTLTVNGAVTFASTLGVTGATTLGTTSVGNLTLTGTVLPSVTNVRDLGSSGARMDEVFMRTADISVSLLASGTSTLVGNVDLRGSLADSTGNLTLGDAVDVSGLLTASAGVTVTGTVTATTFSGSGASLTSVPESAITDGSILARVAASESITGNWAFSGTSTNTNVAINADNTVNAIRWGNGVSTAYLNTIGALDADGSPFLCFWCYHGSTSNTLRRSNGTIPPTYVLGNAAGGLTVGTGTVGSADTDFTPVPLWTFEADGDLMPGTTGNDIGSASVYPDIYTGDIYSIGTGSAANPSIRFGSADDDGLYSTTTDLVIGKELASSSAVSAIKLTEDATTPVIYFYAGSATYRMALTEDILSLSPPIGLVEASVTPADPVSGSSANVYMKADKFIIQYNDAGTVRYKYLDLTGTGVTWVHSTTAP